MTPAALRVEASNALVLAVIEARWRPGRMPGTERDLFAPITEKAQIFAVNRGKIGA